MKAFRRLLSCLLSLLFVSSAIPATASPPSVQQPNKGRGALFSLQLPDGKTAAVYPGGFAVVSDSKQRTVEMRHVPPQELSDRGRLMFDLSRGPLQPFIPNRVVVVFNDSVQATADVQNVKPASLQMIGKKVALKQTFPAPTLTSDARVNHVLGRIGTAHMERLFRTMSRSTLSALRVRALAAGHRNVLNIGNAYRINITNASVRHAVAMLRALPGVAYVSADWRVTSTATPKIEIPQTLIARAQLQAKSLRAAMTANAAASTQPALPANYALTSSAQSMLNSSSNDAVAAYDEIERTFQQLPGQGEIITNVSLGDLDDPNGTSACNWYAQGWGGTTEVINGQRYINWPSMPLIPTYTADTSGHTDGLGMVCGIDPSLEEVGLDFSMMAPLPHNLQRTGEQGSGFTDLLGIAPGAQYRLVVPGNPNVGLTDIDGAFLAAAAQSPTPDVITASLGFGMDVYGFPSRYLEDDPLTESVIASIVSQYDVVVCISAGDGERTFTNEATSPSGGSAPTNVASSPAQQTDLDDLTFTTAPSVDMDSGAIDVGGTTLDDIFAANPVDPANASVKAQHAFAETRWTGFGAFSSGFGSRVNIAAPSDNVLSLSHALDQPDNSINVGMSGGTSASAPEVAAAAAIVRQVARLTGRPLNAAQVRQLLSSTGTAIPNVSQADVPVNMGTALDLRNAVETVLAENGHAVKPNVSRVAIEQRQGLQSFTTTYQFAYDDYQDYVFTTNTDPRNIDLMGPVSQVDGSETGENANAWITIAPDWEGLPANATYKLYVSNDPAHVLATTATARLLPQEILSAAGLPLVSSTSRTITLTYAASYAGSGKSSAVRSIQTARPSSNSLTLGGVKRISSQFTLTFGPAVATSLKVLAPLVPPIVRSGSIPVTYNLSGARNVSNPVLYVSEPGRMNPGQGWSYHPAYQVSLAGQPLTGTVNVPISALQGGGVYGIYIIFGSRSIADPPFGAILHDYLTDIAYTRVEPSTASDARPAAPLLSIAGNTPGHWLDIPYGGSFQVSYDVSNVPGATNALLEISAPGPTVWGNFNTFNNPNGTGRDANGMDAGSVYTMPLSGTSGTVTINGLTANLSPTLIHTLRVLPMAGSSPAGEASDVSALSMDGVNPGDGGDLSGWGINANGTDGLLTTSQWVFTPDGSQLANSGYGTPLTAFATFNQTSNSITGGFFGGPVQPNQYTVNTFGWGIWGNDLGLIYYNNPPMFNTGLIMNPQNGSFNGFWTPPVTVSNTETLFAAPNPVTTDAAFLALNSAQSTWGVFHSDLAAGTTGSIYDITSQLTDPNWAGQTGQYWGIVQNPNSNKAVLVASRWDGGGPYHILSIDYTNGAMTTFSDPNFIDGSGAEGSHGMALDPSTNVLAFLDAGGSTLNLCNVSSQTCNQAVLPWFAFPSSPGRTLGSRFYVSQGLYVADDPVRHLFIVAQPVSADLITNSNCTGQMLIYDENGNLLGRKSGFDFLEAPLAWNQAGLQLNPGTRTGYTSGLFNMQLEPFSY